MFCGPHSCKQWYHMVFSIRVWFGFLFLFTFLGFCCGWGYHSTFCLLIPSTFWFHPWRIGSWFTKIPLLDSLLGAVDRCSMAIFQARAVSKYVKVTSVPDFDGELRSWINIYFLLSCLPFNLFVTAVERPAGFLKLFFSLLVGWMEVISGHTHHLCGAANQPRFALYKLATSICVWIYLS